MKWTQLKKRIEATFADSVCGRVEVWNTRYRRAHDQEGEVWITIDKERVCSAAHYRSWAQLHKKHAELLDGRGLPDPQDPDHTRADREAWDEARRIVSEQGIHSKFETNRALFDYLNLSIEEILSSSCPIIRAFGMLDKRLGKRRLAAMDLPQEPSLARLLYDFRCEAEGITR